MAMDSPHDSDSDWAVNHDLNSHFHSGLGREEYIYAAQHPGSPFNTPHFFNPLFAVGFPDSSYQGYPVLVQYPSSFPNPQQVLGQVTFTSTGPVAPSGVSIPPASHPQHLRCPPVPLGYHPYRPQLDMSSALIEPLDIVQPNPVSMVSPTGHVHPPFTPPKLRRSTTSAAPPRPRAQRKSQKPPVPCPFSVCDKEFERPQERDRHLLLHLPKWIACSSNGCTWTGYRLDTLRKHLCDDHQLTTPGGHGYYQLYDPSLLVKGITKGSISFGDAKQRAIGEMKASVRPTQKWLVETSGRKGKKCSPPQR